ncbi:Leucine-rich repeat and coiled-coil domain-containing protein 1 [Larimichthys crocea]|uniref:Leucine-rich repeat and coiled-coil domain-containing protein 1 n=1 Tax=Larimichthys crocea TaxID=215358 RepID=A0A6G0IHC3_LARCR|nr:Leucine-rich repeat and coiled-coil domain-containing protein 1 [Larimichthys crocea]
MGDKELSLIDKNISSLLDVSVSPTVTSLNLHCNHIERIEGLTSAWHLRHLDLSSNCVSKIDGLSSLTSLRTLNLSCNLITKVEGLNGLVNLTRLNLSYNQINNLTGLLYLHGPEYKLKHISLHGNHLDNIDHLLADTRLQGDCYAVVATDLFAGWFGPARKSITSRSSPAAQPEHQSSQPVCSTAADPADPVNEERIRKLEHQVSQLIQKVPAESECDSGKENRRGTRIPKYRNCTTSRTTPKKTKGRRSDSDQENHKQRSSKSAVGLRRKAGSAGGIDAAGPTRTVPSRAAKASGDVKTKSTAEEETYRTIVEERDQERERRWKAEQAVRKLTEDLKCLQTKVSEEKDLQSMALHTTDRLKEMLLKERSGRSELQTRIDELEGRCQSLTQQLEQARSSEEQLKTALRRLEEGITHGEALRARQQAEEMKRHQELENKAAALKRELDIQRASVRQHKDKLQQLHELLASREQEHRKQIDLRLQPGGADFREAVAKEVASVEKRHAQREVELQEKLAEGRKQYAALEDEFRMGLTIEATRFSEVKEACDQMTAELLELRSTLKPVPAEGEEIWLSAKRDAVTDLKSRLHSLEAEVEQDRRLGVQLELLKKDKARLLSQLTAQESVIDGLRAERRIWGQELAQQGVSLAQDRGRLEARIEVLGAELETQKKQNERDNDALKIKSKIIDDQTETIRKLKEAMQERDDQIRRLREEAVQAQKRLQQQQDEETAQQAELRERIEHLSLRKEELKQQLEDKEAELEEVKRVYSDSSKKWQEKADLLTRLESQVKRMKENFDSKERLLLEERDKATEAHKAAVEKLRSVDDAFRRQLESCQAAHQAELFRLANEKQKQIEQANQKVFEVEEEMRQLLEETETNKRIMEEKMKRLSSVLKDF